MQKASRYLLEKLLLTITIIQWMLFTYNVHEAHNLNFAAALEMAIYNGRMQKYGDELLGIETGNPEYHE